MKTYAVTAPHSFDGDQGETYSAGERWDFEALSPKMQHYLEIGFLTEISTEPKANAEPPALQAMYNELQAMKAPDAVDYLEAIDEKDRDALLNNEQRKSVLKHFGRGE